MIFIARIAHATLRNLRTAILSHPVPYAAEQPHNGRLPRPIFKPALRPSRSALFFRIRFPLRQRGVVLEIVPAAGLIRNADAP